VVLEATHMSMLEFATLEELREYAPCRVRGPNLQAAASNDLVRRNFGAW
jgi:hypothetical protein